MKYCRHCGKELNNSADLCTGCGMKTDDCSNGTANTTVINNIRMSEEKDKWVAFLLCLFFGMIGVHKFYEGKVGLGVVYLLTGGLCGFGWFIDCIILLTKPNKYYV